MPYSAEISRANPVCPSGYSTQKIESGHDFCDRWVVTWDRKLMTTSNGTVNSLSCPKGSCWILKTVRKNYLNAYVKARCVNSTHTPHYNQTTHVFTCTDQNGAPSAVQLTGN